MPGLRWGVEQGRQAARQPRGSVEHAVELDQRDEHAEPFVQQHHHESIESDAAVEQPVKGGTRHEGQMRIAQRDHVVLARTGFQQRAFAEPGAAEHAGKGDCFALGRNAAHFQQTVDGADPVLDRLALAAHIAAGRHEALAHFRFDTRHLFGRERRRPCRLAQHADE
jgi:hypothetical protein